MTPRLPFSPRRIRLLALLALAGLVPILPISFGGANETRTPRLMVGRDYAAAGQRVFVRGVAFPGGARGTLDLGGVPVAALETNQAGAFSGSVRIPSVAPGVTVLRARVERATATVPFTVVPPGTAEPPATVPPTTAPPTTQPPNTQPPTTSPPTTSPQTPTTTAAPPVGAKPGPTNTGFRVPESSLRVVGTPGRCLFASELGVSDGGTISGYRIRGKLALNRRNLRVVDNWIEEGVAASLQCGVGGAGVGAVIEYNEIGPRDRTIVNANAIGDGGFTARYNNIHSFEDGCRCNGNVVFERNWVHDLAGCATCHNDAVQLTDNGGPDVGWGGPTYIRFNALENRFNQTGVVTLGADTGPVRYPVIVEGNWIAGGGYALYGGYSPNPANDPIDVRILNNIWERTFYRCSGAYGPVIYLPRPGHYTWSGNRWATGGEVPPSPNAC